jgi:hypothetical protein
MREETVNALRYDPILRRQVVVRLTYSVGVGPRPDIVRWFLVKEETQRLQDVGSLICRDDADQTGSDKQGAATAPLRPDNLLGDPNPY